MISWWVRFTRSFLAVALGRPLESLTANLLIRSFPISSLIGIIILILILNLLGFPILFVNRPAFREVGFSHHAPRNLNPSLVAEIMVFSLCNSRPHFFDNTSFIQFLIITASSDDPEISTTKSSAYLMYMIRLKLVSL